MKYLVRINPRALNPITKKIDASRVWEVEQAGTKDSRETVKWHCGDVRIDDMSIARLFKFPKQGEPPTELTFYGICTRAQDDAILISTIGRKEVG
jgi:hypothetical protein